MFFTQFFRFIIFAVFGFGFGLTLIFDFYFVISMAKEPKSFDTTVSLGGNNSYQNLIIVHKDVHKLIHATAQETILRYLNNLDLTQEMTIKVNRIRKRANLKEIQI